MHLEKLQSQQIQKQDRYKGENLKKYKAIIAVVLLALNTLLGAQVFSSKFDTKNHPKAKNVWATVRYPNGWQSKEGERPNIVQKFTGDYNGMYVMLMLQIKDAGAPVEKECSDMPTSEFADTFSDKPNNQIAVNVKKTKHEDKPAFIYDMQSKMERAGITMRMAHRVMTVCYKNAIISAWCSPSKFDNQTKTVISTDRELGASNSLCFQYFNSLVLMDKY